LREKMSAARAELRYLGTPDAVRAAFRYARRHGKRPDTLLLVGARDRAAMLSAFDEHLADPEIGISEWDIRVRSLFTWLAIDGPKTLPLHAWRSMDAEALAKLRAEAAQRQNRFDAVLQSEARRLIPIVSRKLDAARDSSARGIAALAPEAAKLAGLMPPDDYGLSRRELISRFAEFPHERQMEILEAKWDLVRGPEMVPVLIRVLDRVEPKALPERGARLFVWGAAGGIEEHALRRLGELAPAEAERIIRRDLASGKPRFAHYAAMEFPAREMSEANGAFDSLLKTNRTSALLLIARFGTSALADRVREIDPDRLPCDDESAFVTYFVRIGEGSQVLKHAMANRQNRGCFKSLLLDVARVVWTGDLERQAVSSLDDPDPEVAAIAAETLSEFGGLKVEAALWRRLEHWSGKWRGRSRELQGNPITGEGPREEERLGDALFRAIDSAQSWIFDEIRRKRIRDLCVDDRCRQRYADPLPGEIRVAVSGGGSLYPVRYDVASQDRRTWERLKRKLSQYPAGTSFRWCSPPDRQWFSKDQREEMRVELQQFLRNRSVTLEPYLADKCP
jgi:hypothetical protein